MIVMLARSLDGPVAGLLVEESQDHTIQRSTVMHNRIEAVLATQSVPHVVRRHKDLPREIRSPSDFASALGYPVERVTKTVLIRDRDRKTFALVVCSSPSRMAMTKIGLALGCGRMEVASPDELAQRVGYPRNGVSPLGCPDLPVLMDCLVMQYPTVLVGAGEVGVEIELAPTDVVRLSKAVVGHFTE
jgi:Cys-tRNA(Pro)/Cys-tRNA(Cys) deacylase